MIRSDLLDLFFLLVAIVCFYLFFSAVLYAAAGKAIPQQIQQTAPAPSTSAPLGVPWSIWEALIYAGGAVLGGGGIYQGFRWLRG